MIPSPGRNAATLEPFLRFVVAHIGNPRYCGALISVANSILDMYAGVVGRSVTVDALWVAPTFFKCSVRVGVHKQFCLRRLHKLGQAVRRELALQQRLLKLQGLMEMLLAGASHSAMTR